MSAVNTAKRTICLPASGWMMQMKWVLIWELFLLYWKCQSLLPVQLLELYWQSRTHGSFKQLRFSRARTLGWEDPAQRERKEMEHTEHAQSMRTATQESKRWGERGSWWRWSFVWTPFPPDCLSCWPLSEKDSFKIFSVPPTFILGETGPEVPRVGS